VEAEAAGSPVAGAARRGIAARADPVVRPSAVARVAVSAVAADIAAARTAAVRDRPIDRVRVVHGGGSASGAAVARAATHVAATHVAVTRVAVTRVAAGTGPSDRDAAGHRRADHSIEADRPAAGMGTGRGHGRRSAGSGPTTPGRREMVVATRPARAAGASDRGTGPLRRGRAVTAAVPIARVRVDPATTERNDSTATSLRASKTAATAGPAAVAGLRSGRGPGVRRSIARVRRTVDRRARDALRTATDPAPIDRGVMPRPGQRTRIGRGSRHRTC
jgi:hypothetical protein